MRLNGAISAVIKQEQDNEQELLKKENELIMQLVLVQRDMFIVRSRNVLSNALKQALDLSEQSIRGEDINNG